MRVYEYIYMCVYAQATHQYVSWRVSDFCLEPSKYEPTTKIESILLSLSSSHLPPYSTSLPLSVGSSPLHHTLPVYRCCARFRCAGDTGPNPPQYNHIPGIRVSAVDSPEGQLQTAS